MPTGIESFAGNTEPSLDDKADTRLRRLQDPATYPEPTSHVQIVETHISWVFLTDGFAYKVKKPVAFDFLDFSSSERRGEACHEELRLNRRFAPDVYLEVLPLYLDGNGSLGFNGTGPSADFALKMRRLPELRTLEQLIQRDELDSATLEALCRFLIQRYGQLPSREISPETYLAHERKEIDSNEQDLAIQCEGEPRKREIHRLHMAQRRFLRIYELPIRERVNSGRVIDGHGDLRPEHIYLTDPPAIIDCLEFSRDLRTLDVLDDLAFLAMECDLRKRCDIGKRLLDVYAEVTSDAPPRSLVKFYKCYRACVRAKVAGLRAEQVKTEEERDSLNRQREAYLALAQSYLPDFAPVTILAVGGLMGTGKSTLARALGEELGIKVLQSDAIRRELFGKSPRQSEFGEGLYRQEFRDRVYADLLAKAEEHLQAADSVILDATFRQNSRRKTLQDLAARHGARLLFIECRCSLEVARNRISHRLRTGDSDSEARPELLEQQYRTQDPLPPELPSVVVNTDQAVEHLLVEVLDALQPKAGR